MIGHFLLVGLGGLFGAIARQRISTLLNKRTISGFPYGTLTVNLLGSLLLGFIVGSGLASTWELIVGTGFMGAFTTFSTFKIENIQMGAHQKWKMLVAYLIISYGGGIALAFLGMIVGIKNAM
ncbi:CrcB protein [Scopulibacillus darangshiensis]|uniref:Fluoride-specific ion channel FluC n=1 Tax=Scopulibacillus darangshiensis TaxID=442528 RepID=A0A4R2PB52_9BACL|nr:fluoride efflux transporter CrcB [Scopulibacillus darangshiensis]TCP31524.1 CrcB protein [Scopulibacillus darangshiensis]